MKTMKTHLLNTGLLAALTASCGSELESQTTAAFVVSEATAEQGQSVGDLKQIFEIAMKIYEKIDSKCAAVAVAASTVTCGDEGYSETRHHQTDVCGESVQAASDSSCSNACGYAFASAGVTAQTWKESSGFLGIFPTYKARVTRPVRIVDAEKGASASAAFDGIASVDGRMSREHGDTRHGTPPAGAQPVAPGSRALLSPPGPRLSDASGQAARDGQNLVAEAGVPRGTVIRPGQSVAATMNVDGQPAWDISIENGENGLVVQGLPAGDVTVDSTGNATVTGDTTVKVYAGAGYDQPILVSFTITQTEGAGASGEGGTCDDADASGDGKHPESSDAEQQH